MNANELQGAIELCQELLVQLGKAKNLPTKEARQAAWDELIPLVKEALRQGALIADKSGREKEYEEIVRSFIKEMEAGITH